jgi:hypothetical protein
MKRRSNNINNNESNAAPVLTTTTTTTTTSTTSTTPPSSSTTLSNATATVTTSSSNSSMDRPLNGGIKGSSLTDNDTAIARPHDDADSSMAVPTTNRTATAAATTTDYDGMAVTAGEEKDGSSNTSVVVPTETIDDDDTDDNYNDEGNNNNNDDDHDHNDAAATTSSLYDAVSIPVDEMPPSHDGQHPTLCTMCVVDTATKQRIVPNTPMPFPLNNECFTGHVMLLIRTPDVDEPTYHSHLSSMLFASTSPSTTSIDSNSNSNNNSNPSSSSTHHPLPPPPVATPMGDTPKRVSEYFLDKKRRFEFQFQIRLKKVPTGPLFLGCELEYPIKVGTITKGLVGLLLAMVRRINPGFHYSWGTQQQVTKECVLSGNYEKTHLSFPVEASMDRIVITKAGDEPPPLGSELYESPESIKRRRRTGAGSVPWNTTDTFTMCLWSAYCDWIQWKSLNVPGVSPFSLCRVTGRQPIYLCVYELPSITPQEYRKKRPPHKRCDVQVYARLEFSHVEKTMGGYGPEIIAKQQQHQNQNKNEVNQTHEPPSLGSLYLHSASSQFSLDDDSILCHHDVGGGTSNSNSKKSSLLARSSSSNNNNNNNDNNDTSTARNMDGRTMIMKMMKKTSYRGGSSRRNVRVVASTIGRGEYDEDGSVQDSNSVCSDSLEAYSRVTMSS